MSEIYDANIPPFWHFIQFFLALSKPKRPSYRQTRLLLYFCQTQVRNSLIVRILLHVRVRTCKCTMYLLPSYQVDMSLPHSAPRMRMQSQQERTFKCILCTCVFFFSTPKIINVRSSCRRFQQGKLYSVEPLARFFCALIGIPPKTSSLE